MSSENEEGLWNAIKAYRNKGKPADISAADPPVVPIAAQPLIQSSVSADQTAAYRRIAAKAQVETVVSTALAGAELPPGVRNTEGLNAALGFLCCMEIFGDSSQQNVARVQTCSAVYDSATACNGDGNALLSEASAMFSVAGPYQIVMNALGNVPKFLAATNNELQNIVPVVEDATAPKGGGLTGGSNPTKPYSSQTPAVQRMITENSGGKITDDASYLANTDPIPSY